MAEGFYLYSRFGGSFSLLKLLIKFNRRHNNKNYFAPMDTRQNKFAQKIRNQ